MGFPQTLVEDATREEILFPALDLLEAGVFVELGTFLGGNLSRCIDHAKGKDIVFTAVDNWAFSNIADPVKKDITGAYFDAYTTGMADYPNTPLNCDSIEAASHFEDGSIDILFVDDDHNKEHVKNLLNVWLPKIKAGGLVCGHDYPDPGVRDAVNEVLGPVGDNHHSWYKRV